jgi:predicted O-methyltransferase YrrM
MLMRAATVSDKARMLFDRVYDILWTAVRDPRMLGWHLFRARHREYRSLPIPEVADESRDWGQIHETHLRSIVTGTPGQSFLEIGIGWTPRVARMKDFQDSGIRYTACDFAAVCDHHGTEFQAAGVDLSKVRFLPNRVGTYAWPLTELVRTGEQFDVIYLDGHHTFYVDLPALLLADLLLKPGGYMLLDDIVWTLNFMKRQLYHVRNEWGFYRKMYDFAGYEPEQEAIPHIKLMAEAILIGRLGYQKLNENSTPFWWALRKPEGAAAR